MAQDEHTAFNVTNLVTKPNSLGYDVYDNTYDTPLARDVADLLVLIDGCPKPHPVQLEDIHAFGDKDGDLGPLKTSCALLVY